MLDIKELRIQIQGLINEQTIIKDNATQLLKELFKKLESIGELELIEKLPSHFLQAYLTFKQAYYSNYQEKHLEQANFNKETYLERIKEEIKLIEQKQINKIIYNLIERIKNKEIELDATINTLQKYKMLEVENNSTISKLK